MKCYRKETPVLSCQFRKAGLRKSKYPQSQPPPQERKVLFKVRNLKIRRVRNISLITYVFSFIYSVLETQSNNYEIMIMKRTSAYSLQNRVDLHCVSQFLTLQLQIINKTQRYSLEQKSRYLFFIIFVALWCCNGRRLNNINI